MADKENKATKASILKSQAEYKGNSHFDLVEVKIIKDGSYYKAGQTDKVHPTVAAILKEKGLIGEYENDVVKRDSAAPLLTDLEVIKITTGEKEL
jgi:hypothetical protein